MKAISALTAVGVLSAGMTVQGATQLKVGDMAPDFTLPSSTGKSFSLSEFRGKKGVVLAFFPAAFTGG